MTDSQDADLLRPYTAARSTRSDLGPCVELAEARPWMIDFEKRGGHREAYYTGLLTSTLLVPGAKDVITMRFGVCNVVISGTALGALYDALLEHRVARIREADPLKLGVEPNGPIVRGIELNPTR